ncbi:MAG: outer membrane lipoprotein carrier protein LolA [Thermoanaerobaculia bacterium]|nr:outer membrane lipoprotein carrier protein LolA [Thermoanaerobaculia bacterium]
MFAIALCLAALAPESRAAAPAAATLDQVLKEVQKRQSAVKTLQADFTQQKTLALLAEPQRSSGTFAYEKPDKVRWNYAAPNPVMMLIADGRMTTFYPRLGRAETLEVGRFQDRIFKYMGAGNAIGELATWFNFRFSDRKGEPTWKLDLVPKTSQVAKRVKSITIWIDRSSYMTSKFEYVEADGDTTLYEFSSIRVNEPVPAAAFKLELPPTVKVETMKLD